MKRTDFREYARWILLECPGHHTESAWSLARVRGTRTLEAGGKKYLRGRVLNVPAPEDVAECERILLDMWKRDEIRPLYNADLDHGTRQYVAPMPGCLLRKWPSGPTLDDCWDDLARFDALHGRGCA